MLPPDLAVLLITTVAAWLVTVGVVLTLWRGGDWPMQWILDRVRQARLRRLQAELNDTQAELDASLLQLAGVLGAGAHEARLALLRESYRASGRTYPGTR